MESGKQELLNQDSWLPPSPRTFWQAQNICIGLGVVYQLHSPASVFAKLLP